jgi:hypothetical protein
MMGNSLILLLSTYNFLVSNVSWHVFKWQEREEEWMNDIDARVQFAVDFGKQNRFLRDLSTFFSF